MAIKPLGPCPFCKEVVRAEVSDRHYLRRDKCACPECRETIYICRSPGCESYAKGGDIYDDEWCPECMRRFKENGGSQIWVIAGTVLAGIATALATKTMDKKD